jgi:hypothetical protein
MTIKEVFERFGVNVIKELQRNIDTRDVIATRKLRQSIDYKVTNLGGDTKFWLGFIGDAEDYAAAADTGRKAGKMPPLEPIMKWITARGIPIQEQSTRSKKRIKTLRNKVVKKSLRQITTEKRLRSRAYQIAYKIGQKGTKPSNFWSDVVKPSLFIDLKKELAAAVKDEIRFEFKIK